MTLFILLTNISPLNFSDPIIVREVCVEQRKAVAHETEGEAARLFAPGIGERRF